VRQQNMIEQQVGAIHINGDERIADLIKKASCNGKFKMTAEFLRGKATYAFELRSDLPEGKAPKAANCIIYAHSLHAGGLFFPTSYERKQVKRDPKTGLVHVAVDYVFSDSGTEKGRFSSVFSQDELKAIILHNLQANAARYELSVGAFVPGLRFKEVQLIKLDTKPRMTKHLEALRKSYNEKLAQITFQSPNAGEEFMSATVEGGHNV
jgi:hypothetical protein